MKSTILRYGAYGAAAICVLFLLSWFLGSSLDFGTQEIIGYASMVLSLTTVFFGIRHFRDRQNSGTLSLGEGLKIGLGISLITALAFGVLDMAYMWMNPGFTDTYYDTILTQLQAELSPAEFEQRKAELESQRALFSNPLMSFLLMAFTVFLIGIIMTVVSSLLLKRSPSKISS